MVDIAEIPVTQGSARPSEVLMESPEDTSPFNTDLEFVIGSCRVTWLNQGSEPLPECQPNLVLG